MKTSAVPAPQGSCQQQVDWNIVKIRKMYLRCVLHRHRLSLLLLFWWHKKHFQICETTACNLKDYRYFPYHSVSLINKWKKCRYFIKSDFLKEKYITKDHVYQWCSSYNDECIISWFPLYCYYISHTYLGSKNMSHTITKNNFDMKLVSMKMENISNNMCKLIVESIFYFSKKAITFMHN